MKIKKSDFVRICKASEMREGECGVILDLGYEGTLVVRPRHKIVEQTGFQLIACSGTNCWSRPPFTVGILHALDRLAVEYD